MASYISKISPVPAFPSYTGHYKVGTLDVEIPISDLHSPAPAPKNSAHIKTIQFRIFYPAAQDATGKKIPWLPNPQRAHLVGYTKFLGIGPMLAELLSFLPRHLHYATIPALKNANLHQPTLPTSKTASDTASDTTSDGESSASESTGPRWPTMVFSHGLGGSRNAYSHVAGSIASHGVVVICPEHRDGSSVVSFVRDPDATQSLFSPRSTGRTSVPYRRIAHDETPEVWAERDDQLRTRCWELGLLHNAILAMDKGEPFRNLNTSTPANNMRQFQGVLNVHRPGSIIFAGHSFGSATVVQFLKSTFYHAHPTMQSMKHPLFTPDPGSELVRQVDPRTVLVLLDMWCFPLGSPSTRELFALPLPAYTSTPECTAPGGSAILAIESETFYKWKEHLHTTARVLSPSPVSKMVSPQDFETRDGVRLSEPNLFYVRNSAHLNQSDFGVLFPWLTQKVFGAESPERALRLNQRAIVQVLRTNGVQVAGTWVGDFVEGGRAAKNGPGLAALPQNLTLGQNEGGEATREAVEDDPIILERSRNGPVDFWHWVDVVGLGGASNAGEMRARPRSSSDSESAAALAGHGDGEHEMEGEIEPHLAPEGVAAK